MWVELDDRWELRCGEEGGVLAAPGLAWLPPQSPSLALQVGEAGRGLRGDVQKAVRAGIIR